MGSNDMMAARFLNYYVKSAGDTLLTEDGKADLTSEAALDCIEYWVDMYGATSPEGSLNFTVLDQATMFYKGQTAFDFTRYRVPDDIAWVDGTEFVLGEELYPTRLPSGDTIVLTGTARMIWHAAGAETDVSRNVAALVVLPPGEVAAQCDAFCQELVRASLLVEA